MQLHPDKFARFEDEVRHQIREFKNLLDVVFGGGLALVSERTDLINFEKLQKMGFLLKFDFSKNLELESKRIIEVVNQSYSTLNSDFERGNLLVSSNTFLKSCLSYRRREIGSLSF